MENVASAQKIRKENIKNENKKSNSKYNISNNNNIFNINHGA